MLRLIEFFKKIHFVLLFVLLEIIAVNFYVNDSAYNKAKMIVLTTNATAGVSSLFSGVNNYLSLKGENERLQNEITELRNIVSRNQQNIAVDDSVSIEVLAKYEYSSANVIGNSITKQENYITINRGYIDGVEPDMAIVSAGSIVGYILQTSERFSVGMSLLNRKFKTSGKIKNSDFFGTIYWDGVSHREIVFTEVPKYAQINIGDTVVTTNYSTRFPAGLMIGTIKSFDIDNGVYYNARVDLSADLARINNVTLVKYLSSEERKNLEENINQLN